jgi:HSP20 family protein
MIGGENVSYFEDIFRDIEDFHKKLTERMFKEMGEIEKRIRSGELEGEWDVKPIERPGVKGYVARGRFFSRETPQISKRALEEVREPLTDVFEDKESIKLYVELPGVEKEDIQLNITEGKAEIKAKNFYKIVDLPTRDVDSEKASAEYKNGVLKVTIPRVKETAEDEKKQKIKIE